MYTSLFSFLLSYYKNYQEEIDIFCRVTDRSGIDDVLIEVKYQLGWMFAFVEHLYNFHDDKWDHTIDISYFNWNDTVSFRFSASDVTGNLNYTQYYNFLYKLPLTDNTLKFTY